MLNHFPVSCTQPLLSHQPDIDPISPLGHQPATAQATSPSPGSPTAGRGPWVLVPTELLQLLVPTKPTSQETPGVGCALHCPALGVFPSSLPQAQGGGDSIAWLPNAISIHPGARGGVRTPGPAQLIPAWSLELPAWCTQRGTVSLGNGLCWDHPCRTSQTPIPADVSPPPAPPWMAPGAPWRRRQHVPCPSSVGPQGCGAGLLQCAASVLLWVLPICRVTASTLSMPAARGGRAERCVGHPSTAALGFLGPWAGEMGSLLGGGGCPWPIPMGCLKMRLLFSAAQ